MTSIYKVLFAESHRLDSLSISEVRTILAFLLVDAVLWVGIGFVLGMKLT